MQRIPLSLATLCLAATASAQAFTIQSTCGPAAGGTMQFNLAAYPTSTTSTAGTTNLRATGAAGTDQVFLNWWYYRVAGDTREYAFNNSATSGFALGPASPKNNRRSLIWTNVDGRGFNAMLTYEVYATSATSGVLSETMTVSNPGTTPLTVTLFHYADFDVCNLSTNNSADFVAPPRQVKVTNAGTCATACYHLGCGWDNYEVATWSALVDKLAGNAVLDDLLNTGTPYGPGDETAAYQWKDRVIPPNGSLTFTAALAIDVQIPACGQSARSTYCTGKAGTNGIPLWSDERAFIGGAYEYTITNGLNGASPVVLLGVGQTCIPIPPIGTVAVNQIISFTLPPFAGGVSNACITIPNNSSLLGFAFHNQSWHLDPGAAGIPLAHTNGLELKLGSQ